MFKWFKEAAIKKSASNIAEIVKELIETANAAHENIQKTATFNKTDRDTVRKLQKRLSIELYGPLPLSQVKKEIIDPALSGQNVSEGAKMAVNHVYDYAIKNFGAT